MTFSKRTMVALWTVESQNDLSLRTMVAQWTTESQNDFSKRIMVDLWTIESQNDLSLRTMVALWTTESQNDFSIPVRCITMCFSSPQYHFRFRPQEWFAVTLTDVTDFNCN